MLSSTCKRKLKSNRIKKEHVSRMLKKLIHMITTCQILIMVRLVMQVHTEIAQIKTNSRPILVTLMEVQAPIGFHSNQ